MIFITDYLNLGLYLQKQKRDQISEKWFDKVCVFWYLFWLVLVFDLSIPNIARVIYLSRKIDTQLLKALLHTNSIVFFCLYFWMLDINC